MTTEERVKNVVSSVAQVPMKHLVASTSIKDDLELDAIDWLSVILELERNFDVVLTEQEVDSIETIHDAARMFDRRTVAA
jgi:acyl carrier protein